MVATFKYLFESVLDVLQKVLNLTAAYKSIKAIISFVETKCFVNTVDLASLADIHVHVKSLLANVYC